MNVIKYNVNSGDVCQIGRQYEYGKTQVIFEGYQVNDSANEIYFKFVGRTEDSKYLIPIIDMTLDITQQLTKHVGQFSCQLEEMNTEGTLVSQSPVFYVAVKRSIKVGADYEVQDPRLETIYQKYNAMYNTINDTNNTVLANESQRQAEWITLKQEVADAVASIDGKLDWYKASTTDTLQARLNGFIGEAEGSIQTALETYETQTDSNINDKLTAYQSKTTSNINRMFDDSDRTSKEKIDKYISEIEQRRIAGEFNGSDGYTPVKGKDYFTDSEISQIQNEVSSGAIGEFRVVVQTETDIFNTNAANKASEFDAHTGQIQADISELKSDLTDFEMVICYKTIGKNKFNEETLSQGYLSNGSLVSHDNWKTTDFIDVSSFDSVVFSVKNIETGNIYNASMFFFNTYDSNKTLIKSVNTQSAVYSVEENVCYIRFAYEYKIYENPQLEEGSERTSYEPYGEKYKLKDSHKNKWIDKKWVAVGDSLTAVNTRTTKHYYDYIEESTGIKVVNMGVSGTGYARGDSYNFYNRIGNVPTDADVVTIFGSGNDIGSGLPIGNPTDNGTDSLCGYINGTIDKLIAIMPTVNLGIVSPTPWVGYAPSISNNTMLLYSKALKEICEIRSIPFLDLYHCSNLRPWTEEGRNACYSKDDGDGVHPDENGHKLIAPRFKAFLETLIL